jgi:hypothetical protein
VSGAIGLDMLGDNELSMGVDSDLGIMACDLI